MVVVVVVLVVVMTKANYLPTLPRVPRAKPKITITGPSLARVVVVVERSVAVWW